jgi:hypothetical protein
MKDPGDDPDGGLKNVEEYPPDKYERVHAAENFARGTLGIQDVDYAKAVRIANTSNRAILSLKKRGVAVPYGIRVDSSKFATAETEKDLAYYDLLPANPDNPGRIFINPEQPAWESDVEAKALRGRFSTGSRYHAIVHEMGELAYHQSIGTIRFTEGERPYRVDERIFQERIRGKKRKQVAEAVSEYAVENHVEFVCEVWAALMLGRDELRENALVMEIYDELEGPKVDA